jgi:hypothetical protein
MSQASAVGPSECWPIRVCSRWVGHLARGPHSRWPWRTCRLTRSTTRTTDAGRWLPPSSRERQVRSPRRRPLRAGGPAAGLSSLGRVLRGVAWRCAEGLEGSERVVVVEVEVEAAGGRERGCGRRRAGRAGDACPTRQLHRAVVCHRRPPAVTKTQREQTLAQDHAGAVAYESTTTTMDT